MSPLAVVFCALALLGRSESSFPPIRLAAAAPRGASAGAEAFVVRDPNVIYLLSSSEAFDAAQRGDCRDTRANRKIASILIHEEAHLNDNADERAAYHAQLIALVRLGSSPETELYQSVQRAMQAVIHAQALRSPGDNTRLRGLESSRRVR